MTTVQGDSPVTAEIFDLRRHGLVAEPFSHIVNERFIAAPLFEQLRDSFPECPPTTGPTGYSLYWEDDDYQRLLAGQPAWRAVADAFHSDAFVKWVVEQFAPVWEREGCLIDLSRARFVPYHEDRIDKERQTLRRIEYAPHELWVRMDIHQGRVGYARAIHRDHARRLISMLVYLCDQTAINMQGGDLVLYAPPLKRWLQPPVTIAPRENLMVAFPCMDRSYHSVSRITSMVKPRNYLQVHVSSSVDMWPRRRF
jgi:hypothetical protein